MKVTLVAVTQPLIKTESGTVLNAEEFMVFCARVSNPSNQLNSETAPRLLRYCIKNKHWSIFEHSSMTVEIETSRAIAAQILRHRSFCFQEFSQRYAVATAGCEPIEMRKKGSTNRQGSVEAEVDYTANAIIKEAIHVSEQAYRRLIDSGYAPECARMVLPLATKTTLYMTGSVRSWIHYLDQRTSSHAQKEHRLVALEIQKIFNQQFPSTAEALKEQNDPTPTH